MLDKIIAGMLGLVCCTQVWAESSVDSCVLTHRYCFNDGAADSIGNAHGTLVNGASTLNGQLVLANNGIDTDPQTGQYVALPENILCTTNFTIEAWVTLNGGDPWQRIIDVGNQAYNEKYGVVGQGFIILTTNGKQLLGQISFDSWGHPSTDFVMGSPGLPVGGEHLVTYTHDTQNGVEGLYLDGMLVGSNLTATVNPAETAYTNFYIGRSQFAQDPFFNGSINELRIYSGALPSDQVYDNYLSGADGLITRSTKSLSDTPDADGDNLPDWWETLYYGNATYAAPDSICSNGLNTLMEAYISGIDPTDPDAVFALTCSFHEVGFVVTWDAISNRWYRVLWSDSLTNHYETLQDDLEYPQNSYTDTVHSADSAGFYRIEVRTK